MDILCGNLRELKHEQQQQQHDAQPDAKSGDPWQGRLSNVPFDCYIQEYGVQLAEEDVTSDGHDWLRMFQILGTSIRG